MKVEAPMWSACPAGRSAVNWGASEGAAAAWCAFHLSTRRLMSSLSTLNSAICASTALKSAMISPFRSARSASAGAAAGRRAVSPGRALNPPSDSSAIRPGLRDRLFENDAFTRREQLRDVEQDDDRRALRLASHERAQGLLGEPLDERRRGGGPGGGGRRRARSAARMPGAKGSWRTRKVTIGLRSTGAAAGVVE